jgi:hypothetical protein
LTTEELLRASHLQGHPTSAELWQNPETKSPDIDIDPSRLRSRLIVEFKLQLMIERLQAVAVLIIAQQTDFFSRHHISSRRQTTYENTPRDARQKIFAATDSLPGRGVWAKFGAAL